MTPVPFAEANVIYGPPPDMDEKQVTGMPAFRGRVLGGSVDGSQITVMAWQLSQAELVVLQQTGVIYLSFIGGLLPHFAAVDFNQATHPA